MGVDTVAKEFDFDNDDQKTIHLISLGAVVFMIILGASFNMAPACCGAGIVFTILSVASGSVGIYFFYRRTDGYSTYEDEIGRLNAEFAKPDAKALSKSISREMTEEQQETERRRLAFVDTIYKNKSTSAMAERLFKTCDLN